MRLQEEKAGVVGGVLLLLHPEFIELANIAPAVGSPQLPSPTHQFAPASPDLLHRTITTNASIIERH